MDDDVTAPVLTADDEAQVAFDHGSRDERYDSVDPSTGMLSAEAMALRTAVMADLRVGWWLDAVLHEGFGDALARH